MTNNLKKFLESNNDPLNNEILDNIETNELEIQDQQNEINNDINDIVDTSSQVQDKIEEAEMLIKILREDGIAPSLIKFLSINKTYINLWQLKLPAIESLNVTTNNQRLANILADQLEKKILNANKALEGLWDTIKEKIDRIGDIFRSNITIAEKLHNQAITMNIDEEKVNTSEVKALTFKDMQYIEKMLNELINLKVPSSSSFSTNKKEIDTFNKDFDKIYNKVKDEYLGLNPNTNSYKTIKVKEIVNDITSKNDKYFKLVTDLKANEEALNKKIFDLDIYIKTDKNHMDEVKDTKSIEDYEHSKYMMKYRKNAMQFIQLATLFINGMLKNYIRLARAVIACKKS